MRPNVEASGFGGRVLGGRWVVGDQLGSGSFGVVHAGFEQTTGAPVAVKLLHPQFLHHHETIARFWNEAEALRRMNHPNVLVLLDAGVADDGVPYLVTELLTGETLRDLLDREGALPPERAMRLLGPAAHALHHAHLAGVVHRDLKPENIFRVRRDGMGTTKILDFGVAKLLDTSAGKKLSSTGIMIGTMAYSAPEQMQGLPEIDHRADQFGFAALVFEALTGQRPFPQAQPFALFQAAISGPRPRATAIRPDLPPAVDAVLARALDPDRERRYANVEEFYLALSSALTTPVEQGFSTTFHEGRTSPPVHVSPDPPIASPVWTAPAEPPRPPIASPPELSARFRAVGEEATRGRVAAYADPDPAGLGQTWQSGVAPIQVRERQEGRTSPSSQPLGGTLSEGTAPPSSSQAAASAPIASRPSGRPPAARRGPPLLGLVVALIAAALVIVAIVAIRLR